MKQNHNISDPTYDNASQMYDYVYAFFYGFVQNLNYIYDDKTIKIGSLLSFTKYTYDYSGNLSNESYYICGSMMLGGNKGYSWARHGVFLKHTVTEQLHFGARYYSSDLSVWLSVDPLSDMYPSMSAYMYTAGNPVMLIDKWGLEGEEPQKVRIRKVMSDRDDQAKFKNKTTGERGYYYTDKDKKAKGVKNDHKNGNFSSEEHYDSDGGAINTIDGGTLSGASITGTPSEVFTSNGYTFIFLCS